MLAVRVKLNDLNVQQWVYHTHVAAPQAAFTQ